MSEEKDAQQIWQKPKEPRKPRFYVPNETPPQTAEQTVIQRWLDLADEALKPEEDPDPNPSAA